jgi:hypothetical protein
MAAIRADYLSQIILIGPKPVPVFIFIFIIIPEPEPEPKPIIIFVRISIPITVPRPAKHLMERTVAAAVAHVITIVRIIIIRIKRNSTPRPDSVMFIDFGFSDFMPDVWLS